jgi:anion-transporting  ArsA/GET3 family ATPase
MSVLDRRLVVVTGKGGVGKTTVAAALGLVAARQGRRTIVCEVARQDRLSGLFGVKPHGHDEHELAPGLAGISVDPEVAREEWLRRQLRSSTLAGMVGGSRIFQLLAAAAPGLDQLVTIGKVWDLAQLERRTRGSEYDLAIVDAPASGHGLGMLRAPRTYHEIARVGPIHRQAGIIDGFLRDRRSTAVLAVALAEEMPVTETLELETRLRDEIGIELEAVLVNAVLPERFSAADAERVAAAGGDAIGPALEAALAEPRRVRGQRSQLRRLRRAAGAQVETLPYLFAREIGVEQLDSLSRELERRL